MSVKSARASASANVTKAERSLSESEAKRQKRQILAAAKNKLALAERDCRFNVQLLDAIAKNGRDCIFAATRETAAALRAVSRAVNESNASFYEAKLILVKHKAEIMKLREQRKRTWQATRWLEKFRKEHPINPARRALVESWSSKSSEGS